MLACNYSQPFDGMILSMAGLFGVQYWPLCVRKEASKGERRKRKEEARGRQQEGWKGLAP